jgi:hypothetical protein
MSITNSEKTTFWLLLIMQVLICWLGHAEDYADPVLIVISLDALVSIRSVACYQTMGF